MRFGPRPQAVMRLSWTSRSLQTWSWTSRSRDLVFLLVNRRNVNNYNSLQPIFFQQRDQRVSLMHHFHQLGEYLLLRILQAFRLLHLRCDSQPPANTSSIFAVTEKLHTLSVFVTHADGTVCLCFTNRCPCVLLFHLPQKRTSGIGRMGSSQAGCPSGYPTISVEALKKHKALTLISGP